VQGRGRGRKRNIAVRRLPRRPMGTGLAPLAVWLGNSAAGQPAKSLSPQTGPAPAGTGFKRSAAIRDRRSARHADDADGRRRGNRHDRHAAPPRDRNRGREYGRSRDRRNCGRSCTAPGSRLTPRSCVRLRGRCADDADGPHADSRYDRHVGRQRGRSPGRGDARGPDGSARCSCSYSTLPGQRCDCGGDALQTDKSGEQSPRLPPYGMQMPRRQTDCVKSAMTASFRK
jgi:hypothetical protein